MAKAMVVGELSNIFSILNGGVTNFWGSKKSKYLKTEMRFGDSTVIEGGCNKSPAARLLLFPLGEACSRNKSIT